MRVLEEKHKEEESGLKKKLQWFAENQELLDRDADRLKAAAAQIQQLTEQVTWCYMWCVLWQEEERVIHCAEVCGLIPGTDSLHSKLSLDKMLNDCADSLLHIEALYDCVWMGERVL